MRFHSSLADLPVGDFVRAVDKGHYPTRERTLLITRAGEFGGNGAAVSSLVGWLLNFAPGVFIPLGIDAVRRRRTKDAQAVLEKLATDWASRQIQHPQYLRQYVETKRRWYPSVLAQRLALSEPAAHRLLEALGYEPGEEQVMQLKSGREALSARDTWVHGETAQYYDSVYEDVKSYFEE